MLPAADFIAHGKLLITGEYLVLKGAEALAFPVRFGQTMTVSPVKERLLYWFSREKERLWFSSALDPETMDPIRTTHAATSAFLQKVLLAARSLNPAFLFPEQGYRVVTQSNYPLQWGLGSSSSLISLISQWAGVDAHELHRMVSSGSGYDVACASRDQLFLFKTGKDHPEINPVDKAPALEKYAYFFYQGRKQDSSKEVAGFLNQTLVKPDITDRISQISREVSLCEDYQLLCDLVDEHEQLLSDLLQKPRLGLSYKGMPGVVKSLGAWGGDFALALSDQPEEEVFSYFHSKGVQTILTFAHLKVNS